MEKVRGRVKRFSSDIWFRMGCGRSGAEGAFLGKLLRRSRVKKVLSGGCVSRQIFGLGWGGEGAGQSFRFCLGFGGKMGFGFLWKSWAGLPFLAKFLEKREF